jgi:hypothetical protein
MLKFETALFLVDSAAYVDEWCQKPNDHEITLQLTCVPNLPMNRFQRSS